MSANNYTYHELSRLRVPDLRRILRDQGKRVGGNKTELINRLVGTDPSTVSQAASSSSASTTVENMELDALARDYQRLKLIQNINAVFSRLPLRLRNKANNVFTRIYIIQACYGKGDVLIPPIDSPVHKMIFRELSTGRYNPIHGAERFMRQVNNLINDFYSYTVGRTTKYRFIDNGSMGFGLQLDDDFIQLDKNLVGVVDSRYIGPPEKKEYYMARLVLLYSIVGIESGYQYGLPRDITSQYELELFASPFNRTLPKFCSLFYEEVDKLFGSIGKFPDILNVYRGMPIKIQANPPFINEIQDPLAQYVIQFIDEAVKHNKEVVVLITMGNWEDSTAYRLLSQSPYLVRKEVVKEFVDYSSGKVMALKGSAISFELRSVR